MLGVVFIVIIGIIFLVVFFMISPNIGSQDDKSYEMESKLASLVTNIISDANIVVSQCHYSSIPYMLTQCGNQYQKRCDDGSTYCDYAVQLINDTLLKEVLAEQYYNYSVELVTEGGDPISTLPMEKGTCKGSRFASRYRIATTEDGYFIYADLQMCR